MELKNWTIFGLLDPEFFANIKIACVFGNLGHEAILCMKNDDVYSLGSNSSGCLGVESITSSLTPMKVDYLCQKNIIGFSYGAGPHVVAFTKDGGLYAWGHNGFCQLGLGTSCQTVVPTLVSSGLLGKKIIDVSCGSHHSIALTSEGEVFAFGQNNSGQIGCGSTANQPTPRRVSAVIGNVKIVKIACGQTSTFAVSDTGEVYAWGFNGNGNLGLGNTVNQYNPTKVILPNIFITKVVCGTAHTLALSDDGVLYSWGANSYGQLGAGHKSNMTSPLRVANEVGRIIDIAAIHYGHISACQTHTKIYMWGQCRGQSITSPVETLFTSLHDVFACYSTPPVTYLPIEAKQTDEPSIIDALRLSFDDPKTCDVQFSVEGKLIHAHKAILKIRSDHFRCMFNGKWKETEESPETVINVEPTVRFSVFRAFLQYLYTDKIDLPAEEAVDLLKLANYYCEVKLRNQCEVLIKQSITIDNAARLYASAILYNAKELEEFSFQYMLYHLTAVVQSESFQELDGETIKNLMIVLADNGAFKY
ncbi:RCC1 and BTB domain-containing protein 1 isoform X1 [Folsomia candida]|uniref:RCC1 and BTB domain-containing protein 1 isoform X1 n=1 Tax=Folsomia candida TaxID=158441 RepID=UPI000B908ACC|nr:RCC1 and BTB domain-containing protein 1 isoform X1 [Folsomia candida]